jgi:Uma2 family endonuclease
MSAVSIAGAWPKQGEPFTVDDLDRMPDDGRRYELIDGMLIVSPAPNIGHQRVIIVLGSLLESACPEHLVVVGDVGVRIAENSALEPDVVVRTSAMRRECALPGHRCSSPRCCRLILCCGIST